jgi:hypothetical protein
VLNYSPRHHEIGRKTFNITALNEDTESASRHAAAVTIKTKQCVDFAYDLLNCVFIISKATSQR